MDEDHRSKIGRRTWDHVYYWMPIVLSFVISALGLSLSLGILWGGLKGDLRLIEYRLEELEKHPRAKTP